VVRLIGLIMLFLRLIWWCLVLELWLCWALIALIVTVIASLTGHERVARQWMRSMNWRRVFHFDLL
jgi:hypothetical protein